MPVRFISSTNVPPLLKSSDFSGIGSILVSMCLLKGTIFLRSSNLSPVNASEISATSILLSLLAVPYLVHKPLSHLPDVFQMMFS